MPRLAERLDRLGEQAGGDLRRVHPDEHGRARPRSPRTPPAAGRRARRRAAGSTSKPASGSQSPGSPSSTSTRRAAGVSATAYRVSARHASATAAAPSASEVGDQARLRPCRARAPWRSRSAIRSPGRCGSSHRLASCRRSSRSVPRTVPVTFERPPARRGRRPVDLLDPPAGVGGAQHHLERPAEAPVAEPERRAAASRRAARIGPMSVSVPARRRTISAERPVGDPGVQRPGAGLGDPRLPSTRSASPAATGVGDRSAARAGSSEPSQSMKQTTSERGRRQAGEAGGAEAAARLGRRPALRASRAIARRAVGRAVVDDDRPVAGREAGEHARDRLRLVEHRQDHVDSDRLARGAHDRLNPTVPRSGRSGVLGLPRGGRRSSSQPAVARRSPASATALALSAVALLTIVGRPHRRRDAATSLGSASWRRSSSAGSRWSIRRRSGSCRCSSWRSRPRRRSLRALATRLAFLVGALAIALAARLAVAAPGTGPTASTRSSGSIPRAATSTCRCCRRSTRSGSATSSTASPSSRRPSRSIRPPTPRERCSCSTRSGIDGPRAFAAADDRDRASARCRSPTCSARGSGSTSARARVAALLIAFSPAAMLYGVVSTDAMFATLGLAAACLLLGSGVRRRILGGLALAVASFFSWALLALGAFAALVVLRGTACGRRCGCRRSRASALLAFYGVLYAATGFDPIGAVALGERGLRSRHLERPPLPLLAVRLAGRLRRRPRAADRLVRGAGARAPASDAAVALAAIVVVSVADRADQGGDRAHLAVHGPARRGRRRDAGPDSPDAADPRRSSPLRRSPRAAPAGHDLVSRVLVTGGAGFIGSHLVDALLAAGRGGAGPRQPRPARPPVRRAARAPADRRPSSCVGDLRSADDVGRGAGGRRPGLPPRRDRRQRRVDGQRPQGDRLEPGRHRDAARGGDRTPRPDPPGRGRLLDGRLRRGLLPLRRARHRRAGAAARRRSSGERRWEPLCPQLRPRARAGAGHRGPAAAPGQRLRDHASATPRSWRSSSARPTASRRCALRYLNVYGPRQALGNPYTGVAAIFSARLLGGRSPRVFEDGGADPRPRPRLRRRRGDDGGDGRPGRARATPSTSAPGDRIRIAELAAQARRAARRPTCEPEITGEFRAGDIRHCFADPALARELLGFEAEVTIDDGLPELVEWVAAQSDVDERGDEALEGLRRAGLVG